MTIDEYSEILKKCNFQEIDFNKTNHVYHVCDKYDLFFVLDEMKKTYLVNCYLRNNCDKVPEKIKIISLCLGKDIKEERLNYIINKTIDKANCLYYNKKEETKERTNTKRRINLE